MNDFEYEQAVKLLSQMIKNDILNIMNKQQKFNVSDINEILNIFLKTMKESFAKTAAAFTQIC